MAHTNTPGQSNTSTADRLALRCSSNPPRRQDTERLRQFIHANFVNIYGTFDEAEDAWRRVIDYSPDDSAGNGLQRYYSLLAKTHLVRLYLKEAKYDLALYELSDLSNLDETEVEFRAFGLAGEAIVYAMQGERELFVDRVILVLPLRKHLQLHPDMLEQFEALARASFLGS